MSEKKVEENEGDPLVHGVKVEEDREDFQQSVTSHSEQQNLLKEDEKTMENFENIKIETIEDTRRVFPDTEESGTSSFNKKDDATTPASPVSSEKKLNPVPVDSSQPMSASSAEPTTFWMNFTEPSPKTAKSTTICPSRFLSLTPNLPIASYIKRPMNAFLCYARKRRPVLSKMNANSSNRQISVEFGNECRKLSEEQKSPYYAEARRLQWVHSQKFPDWVYTPKKRKRSASHNIPEASPRKHSSQNSGNLQSETFPQRHVPEPTYHTVINMPREAPVPRSRRQFPGPSNLYLEGPLLDTRNLVTPTHLPIGPPSYVPGMPYYQPRLLPDYNCTSQQDPCMGLDNGSSQNPTTSDRLNQEDVWDTDSNNANISPEDENFNIFNW